MSEVVKTGRSLALALALATIGATGGIITSSLLFPAPASASEQHPCEEDECNSEANCPIWNPGCGATSETCVTNDGQETYCDSVAEGCETKACGHA